MAVTGSQIKAGSISSKANFLLRSLTFSSNSHANNLSLNLFIMPVAIFVSVTLFVT